MVEDGAGGRLTSPLALTLPLTRTRNPTPNPNQVEWDDASRRRKALLLFNRLTEGWYETYMGELSEVEG